MNDQSNKPWAEITSGVVRDAIPARYLGYAEITPKGEFAAGSYASFTLTYTAGLYGIDDSGSLRICFRFASDQSNPQFDDPKGVNYCTVEASNGATLQLRWDQKANVRPWDRTLRARGAALARRTATRGRPTRAAGGRGPPAGRGARRPGRCGNGAGSSPHRNDRQPGRRA